MKHHRIHQIGLWTTLVVLCLMFSGAALAAPTCTTDCYVAPSGLDSNSGELGDPLLTIQAAINQVSSGGTVHVAAGTYNEQVIVNKSLTMTGAGEATTVIGLPAVVTRVNTNEVTQVDVTGAVTVNIDNLSVSGPLLTPNGCSDRYTGIWARGGATLNLADVTVRNIHLNANGASGCQTGLAIYYGQGPVGGTTGSGTLSDVTATNFQKNGITVGGTGSNITVINSLIEEGALDWSPYIAQNGIQIGRGAVASVSSSTIDGMHCGIPVTCGPDATSSSGFIIFETENITVYDVTVSNSDMGLVAYLMTGGGAVNISESQFIGSPTAGIYTLGGDVSVTDTNVTGGYWGVITQPYLQDAMTTFDGGSITGTTLEGFYVDDTIAGFSAAGSSIHNAHITGNGDGVFYDGPASISATCNWWGSFTGPSGVGSGDGDTVSAGVTFSPWLISSAPGAACETLTPPFKIVKVSGDNQSAEINSPFANPLVVMVTDANDNPIEGVTVQFSVLTRQASATFTPADGQDVTDTNGQASILATADGEVGEFEVVVSVGTIFTTFTMNNDPATVTAPTDLAAVATGMTKTTLTWTDTTTVADTLALFRSDDAGVTFDPIATPDTGDITYDDTGLLCGTAYQYRLDVTNVVGTASSNIASVTTNACGELLNNGSFELALAGSWNGVNLTGDNRKCNVPANAFNGLCSLRFKGSVGEASIFKQRVTDLSALTAGDTLYLSAAFKSSAALPHAVMRVVVKYGTIKDKPLISFQTTSATFVVMSEEYLLTGTPTRLIVKISNKTTAGKVFVDQVSLSLNDVGTRSGDSLLPPPSAPEQFRGNN